MGLDMYLFSKCNNERVRMIERLEGDDDEKY
jgi:hypothetical protein